MTTELPARSYEFGPFRLDAGRRLLLRDGEPLSLTPKAFEALLILIQHRGRVVGKEELMEKLWPDTHVMAATLSQNIFTLRKVLGDEQHNPTYIKTIPRRGYRFVAGVQESDGDGPGAPAEAPAGGPAEREYNLLAVLPLVNDNADPSLDYLSEGITESIIRRLSQSRGLRVVARSIAFRYKGGDVDPQQAGRELNVRQVLSGRLLKFGDRLVIKVELIDVAHGWQLWGEQYDRELSDVLAVEQDIARHIAEALHLTLGGEAPRLGAKNYTENTEAYQLYLKGRYYWNKPTTEGCLRAVEFFEKAIAADDTYALAYAGLADAYVALDLHGEIPPAELMPKARAAALKALELDERLAEARVSLGCIKTLYDHDWEGAEEEFKRAIKLKPGYPHAHSWYSLHLLALGRFEESFAQAKRALELDPLDVEINHHLGWYYLYTRQYDKAIEQLRRTLELQPKRPLARLLLARAYEQKGEYAEAIAEFERTARVEQSPLVLGFLGHAYALAGDREKAGQLLEELKEMEQRRYVPPYSLGLVHLGMNDKARALNDLRAGSRMSNQWMIYARVNPAFDSLRSDPAFHEILRDMNLEE